MLPLKKNDNRYFYNTHYTWTVTAISFPCIIGVILSPLGTTIKATKLSAVAMKESYSDVIEVRLASDHNGLEVLQNQKTLSFTEQSWMDLYGETLIHLTAYDEVIDLIPLCSLYLTVSMNLDAVLAFVKLWFSLCGRLLVFVTPNKA